VLLNELLYAEETGKLARLLVEDFKQYLAGRNPDRRQVLLIIDEFSAIADGERIARMVEVVRSYGAAVVLAPQCYDGMGGPEASARILNAAHTVILHAVPEPEPIVKAAGTRMATEWSLQHERGLSTDVGSTRAQHQLRVDPNEVRRLPPGMGFVIGDCKGQKVQITAPPRVNAQPSGDDRFPRPEPVCDDPSLKDRSAYERRRRQAADRRRCRRPHAGHARLGLSRDPTQRDPAPAPRPLRPLPPRRDRGVDGADREAAAGERAIMIDMAKRSYGTGSLFVRVDAAGREAWYGQWRAGDAIVKRKLGEKRRAGERRGMTKAQAEAELRRRIEAERPTASAHERPSVEDAGRRYLDHLASVGRKRSTLMDYESHLRVHLAPFFGLKPLHRIEPRDVEAFIGAKRREGRAPKSILNYLGLLHSIFEFGQRRGWTSANPCKLVDKPRVGATDADIRFLDQAELEALLRAAPDTDLGRRPPDVAHRGDDRPAPGRAARVALARRRLARRSPARSPQLRPRRVRDAQVPPLVALRPARRPRRRRAGHPPPRHRVRRRQRPRLRPSPPRHTAGALAAPEALQGRCEGRWHP